MSLPAVLGTGLALMLISSTWTAAAEPKAKQSSLASDRHASASRSADKEDSERKSAAKGRAQKEEDSEKKGRAQKDEDSERKSAGRGRASKDEDSERKSAGRGRAQKDAASEPSADSETVAALRQQLRDLRRQFGDMERLRAELAAAKASDETLPALKQQLRDLRKQVADMERLRAELAAVKAQVQDSAPKPTIWGGVPLTLPASLSAPASGSPAIAALA